MVRLTFTALLATALACGPVFAQSARTVAKLTNVQGSVLVSGETGMSTGTNGLVLAPGVRVITTAGAKATVNYDTGCDVNLDADSSYTVKEREDCALAAVVPAGAGAGVNTGLLIGAAALIGVTAYAIYDNNRSRSPN